MAVDSSGHRRDLAADEAMEDAAFFRWYGPLDPFTLDEVRTLFDPIGVDWWIAGGRAAEAFHGVPRTHEDVDVSVFRRDIATVNQALKDRWHLWSVGASGLRPLDERHPEPADDADQVWIREHALAPWKADVVMTRDWDGRWQSRRDPDLVAPLHEVTWERDGVRYLNPEIVLSFKARQMRSKDEHDFAGIAPRLDDDARTYLAGFLDRFHPDHPWRSQL
jgi:hypothetical protein